MTKFKPDTSRYTQLKNKVVVLSGGSTGIGAATVKLLSQNGAKVVFGDTNKDAAESLISGLKSSSSENGEVTFVQCNVVNHKDIYQLFKIAHEKYGRIDHSVSSAGIFEVGNWYSPELSISNLADNVGDSTVLDVNILGSAQFARAAAVFMRDGVEKGKDDKSLTLLSSVNAFRESPGLFMYQTSKHAIQGLMRSSRKILYERDGIRVNCICPGVTDTPMAAFVAEKFRKMGLYQQTPESVATLIVGFMITQDMWGKAVYIEGGDGWEFEDSFYACQPQWLGEEATRRMRKNAEAVQKGALIKE